MYQFLTKIGNRYFSKHQHKLFKWVFNASPMYRRSTGKVVSVSPDFSEVLVRIPFSYKNKNYAGSIFGGSLFSATDPIYMVQLIQLIGHNYVVWDKESTIRFRRPAKEDVFALFAFTKEEVQKILEEVNEQGEMTLVKHLTLQNKEEKVFVEIDKTLYIATKSYYKEKLRKRKS